MSEHLNSWKITIEPKGSFFDLKLKEVWSYRDLIFLFVKREFISKYKQTILGPLWAIIQPVLTTVVFTVIFGSLAKLTTADLSGDTLKIPSFLFYMIGTILWTYFSSTVAGTSNTFIGHAAIMGKVYYPRLVTPIASALSNLIPLLIQMILFVILAVVNVLQGNAEIHIGINILLFPLLLLQLMMASMGTGLVISALTTKYRDLTMLVAFGLELWKYATPVAYGLSLIPEAWLKYYVWNPVTPIVTTARYICFGSGYFSIGYYLLSWAVTFVLFFAGLLLFNRIEKNFMDTI